MSGEAWASGPIEIRFRTASGSLLTTVQGPSFSAPVTVPQVAPGQYLFVARQAFPDHDWTVAAPFRITGSSGVAPPPPGTAPRPLVTPPPGGSLVQISGTCGKRSGTPLSLTSADDLKNGTAGADLIFAGAGEDVIDGLAGDDCIDLGAGTDRGQGGRGDDVVLAGRGSDRVGGGAGADRLRGHAGGDRINGGAGEDSIKGNSGPDRLKGASGTDSLSGGGGGDRIDARDGERDKVACGSGRDTVIADRRDRAAGDCERVRRRG